jgi:hypothetical protein
LAYFDTSNSSNLRNTTSGSCCANQKREAGERDENPLKKDRNGLAAHLEGHQKSVEEQKARNEALMQYLI